MHIFMRPAKPQADGQEEKNAGMDANGFHFRSPLGTELHVEAFPKRLPWSMRRAS